MVELTTCVRRVQLGQLAIDGAPSLDLLFSVLDSRNRLTTVVVPSVVLLFKF